MMSEKLLTTQEAAECLGVSPSFLERDRWAGAEIPFVRVGTRTIRYQLGELDNYITGQTRTNTNDLWES